MAWRNQTVFIVDDDPASVHVLQAIAESLKFRTETARSADELFSKCAPTDSGCLVLDVRMPGISGLDLLDSLSGRGIELPVIVISGYADVPMVLRAIKSGALDFLEKPVRPQDLLDRVNTAFRLDRERRLAQASVASHAARYATLTSREREVMQLLVSGRSGKQIAGELAISYKTVEKFRGRTMRKMGAEGLAQLVLIAVSLGIIRAGQAGT